MERNGNEEKQDPALESLKSSVVLMVDDEPTTLDMLEMHLQGEGYGELVKVEDPLAALGTIRELQPDVVLLNLRMPHVSGLEILASMRAEPALASIPVIIITGSSDASAKHEALELGATDFLAKPVDPSELALRLRNTLASRAFCTGQVPVRRAAATVRSPQRAGDDRFQAIVEAFVERLGHRIDEMENSLTERDYATLGELAHWLKGAAGTVGLHDFTPPAEALGRLARQRRSHGMAPLIQQMRLLTERLQERDAP